MIASSPRAAAPITLTSPTFPTFLHAPSIRGRAAVAASAADRPVLNGTAPSRKNRCPQVKHLFRRRGRPATAVRSLVMVVGVAAAATAAVSAAAVAGGSQKACVGGGAPARLAAPPQCPRTTTMVAGRVGLPTAVDRPQGLRCLRRGAATAAWRPSQRLWRLTWAPQPTSLAAAVAAAGAAGLGTGGMPVAHAGWTRGAAGRGTELQLGKPWRCEERSATQKGAPAAQKGTPVEGAPTSRLSPLTPPDGMEKGDDGAAAGRRRPRW